MSKRWDRRGNKTQQANQSNTGWVLRHASKNPFSQWALSKAGDWHIVSFCLMSGQSCLTQLGGGFHGADNQNGANLLRSPEYSLDWIRIMDKEINLGISYWALTTIRLLDIDAIISTIIIIQWFNENIMISFHKSSWSSKQFTTLHLHLTSNWI